MDARFAFADSEVSSVTIDEDGTLLLRFSAARVAGSGAPRYLPGLVLRLDRARLDAPPSGCIGRVAEGEVLAAGQCHAVLDIPPTLAGPLRLNLRFANGSQLGASAEALAAEQPAGGTAAEHYHC